MAKEGVLGFSGSLDQDFLRRVQRTTLVLGCVLALCVASFVGARGTVAYLTGVAISVVNLAAIRFIVQRVLQPQPQVGLRLALGVLVKIPALFLVVFLCVQAGLPIIWLVAGFSTLFLVVVGKALSLLLLHNRRVRSGGADATPHAAGTGSSRSKRLAGSAGLVLLLALCAPFASSLHWEQQGWTTQVWSESSALALADDRPSDMGAGTDALEGTDAHTTQPLFAQHESDESSDEHKETAPAPSSQISLTNPNRAAPPQHQTGAAEQDGAVHGGEAHEEGEHSAEAHDDHGGVQHFPNLVTYLVAILHKAGVSDSVLHQIEKYENLIFALIATLLLGLLTSRAMRHAQMVPGKLQNLVEYLFGGYYDFVRGVLGDEARRYIPFVGTLFFYIWAMNWMGMVPGGHSATSSPYTTFPLAICVFLYVQFVAMTRLGPGKYLFHLAGDPVGVVGWAMVPLMLPLHLIGEVAKPLSLALRLFGNIMGEDTLLALFAGLVVIAIPHVGGLGIPFQLPFMFLAMLASTIQALVFSLLATIYLSQVLPHGHEEEHAH
jgi:F-type H+-transporting ATPase subunit a